MKRLKSRLAIILTLMMIFTSFEFVGVFAENGDLAPADEAQVTVDATSEGTGDGETTGSEEPEVTAPEPVTGLAAYASSNAVVVLWDKVDDSTVKYLVNGQEVSPSDYNGKNRYDIGGLAEGQGVVAKVEAYRLDGSEKIKSASQEVSNSAVRTIRYRIRIKKGGVLKSHGGNGPGSIRVTKGQYIDCYGFGGGKYIFNYGGSIFYCNKSRTNKRSCIYNSGRTYSKQEAEFFVNDRGLSSSTGTLVWINTYTQTLYMFNGSAGSWHCDLASKCSTGKAASPTPTGVSGRKTIWKKISKRHGIKFWSPFSQINSVHGKKAKWRMGAPKSNGCVRNYVEAAQQVYYGAPIGTTVLVY